jgi:hypothetical protein
VENVKKGRNGNAKVKMRCKSVKKIQNREERKKGHDRS